MCTEGDILVATWDMEIERTISHSWSSDSDQPEPFVKLLFEGCVKEIKVAFPGHRYDVFLESLTPIPPKPALPFTEIFRNTLASLFQSSQGNVPMHSDQKESPSEDGDGDETHSTADDPNPKDPKDPEDGDRVHSDGTHKGQDSSGQDSPAQDSYKVDSSTDDQNFQLDPETSITDIFMNAYETVYGSSPENVQGHKDSPVQDGYKVDSRSSTDDQNFQLDPEISITDIFMNAYETVYGSSPENVQGHKNSPVQDADKVHSSTTDRNLEDSRRQR